MIQMYVRLFSVTITLVWCLCLTVDVSAQDKNEPPENRPGYKPEADSEGSDEKVDPHNPFKKDEEEEEDCVAGGSAASGEPVSPPKLIVPPLPDMAPIPQPALSRISAAGSLPAVDPPTVRAASGECVLERVDVFLPGINGLNVAIRRTHKSGLAAYASTAGMGVENNLNRGLKLEWSGYQLASFKLVTGHGRVSLEFVPSGLPGWFGNGREPSKFYHDQVSSIIDRYMPNGHIERYEILGSSQTYANLTEVRDLNGNKVTYEHRNDVANAPLEYVVSRITDTLGRQVDVVYEPEDEACISALIIRNSAGTEENRIDYNYQDIHIKDVKLKVLSSVTGLPIPTLNSQGQLELDRPTEKYLYDVRRMPRVNKYGARLKEVISPKGPIATRWEYIDDPLEGYNFQVKRQIDRPGSEREGIHTFEYEVQKTTYTNPMGDQAIYFFTPELQLREVHEQIGESEWAITSRTIDSACGCGQVTDVFYPNGVREHREYEDGMLTEVWIESNEMPGKYLVKRYKYAVLDPVNGQYFTAVTHHQPFREATPAETFGACKAGGVPCWGTSSIPYHRVIENVFNNEGQIETVINPAFHNSAENGQTLNTEMAYDYHPNGQLEMMTQRVNGVDVTQLQTTLDADGLIEEATLIDQINGGSWTLHQDRDEWNRVTESRGPNDVRMLRDISPSGHVYRLLSDWNGVSAKVTREMYYDLTGSVVYERTSTHDGLTMSQAHLRDEGNAVTHSTVSYLDGSQKTWEYGYDATGLRTHTKDWRGMTDGIEYGMGIRQLPVHITQEFKNVKQTLWKAGYGADVGFSKLDQPTSWTDAGGVAMGAFYDEFGRLASGLRQSGEEGGQPILLGFRYGYNAGGFVERIDSGGVKGNPISPAEECWDVSYAFDHNLVGHVLRTATYTTGGQDPARESFFEIDGFGRTLQSESIFGDEYVNADRTLSEWTYDALGRVIGASEHLANQQMITTTLIHDDVNESTEVTTIEGSGLRSWKLKTQYLRDLQKRVETIYDQAGIQTRTNLIEHDGMGRVVASVDELGLRTELDYTQAGDEVKKVSVIIPNGTDIETHYNYDPATGLLSSIVDPENKPTIFSYHDSCTSTADCFLLPARTTHADGRWDEVQSYTNLQQPLVTLDSWGRQHTFEYDSFGRLTKDIANTSTHPDIIGPDTREWEYDSWDGYLKSARLLQNQQVIWEDSYVVNKLGELTLESQGSHNAQLTQAWGFRYGLGGELLEQTFPGGLGFDRLTVDHDARGYVSDIHHWDSGVQPLATMHIEHDGARLDYIDMGPIQQQFSYEADWGRVNELLWSQTGSTFHVIDGEKRSLDAVDQVVSRQRVMDATGEVGERDDAGQLVGWFKGVPGALNHIPGSDPVVYDEAHRFDLDNVGARNQVTVENTASGTTTHPYDTNAVHFYTSVNGQSHTPEHGLLASGPQHTFHYDAWGNLIEVRDEPSGQVVRTFNYDSSDRRVLSSDQQGGLLRFVYDGSSIAAAFDPNATSRRTYSGGMMRVTGNVTQTYQLLTDHQGSIIGLTDGTGNLLERYRYEAFGKRTVEDAQGSLLSDTQFGLDLFYRGQPFDTDLGWYDLGDWYDPAKGAFVNPGPGVGNLYKFAGADPLSR